MKPGPNTKSMCPDPPALLEFTVEGPVIRMKSASGEDHAGSVPPDGVVDLRFTSTSTGAGTVIVTGNARSRDLQMTVPRGAPGCVWTQAADAAEARRVVSWNATIQQTGGNVQRCLSGHRGRVQTRRPSLAVYAQVVEVMQGSYEADIDSFMDLGHSNYKTITLPAKGFQKIDHFDDEGQLDFTTWYTIRVDGRKFLEHFNGWSLLRNGSADIPLLNVKGYLVALEKSAIRTATTT
jgi:hypothetical protein